MAEGSREAWERLYAKHGLQFGGSGDVGPLERLLRADMLVLDAGCGEGKTTEGLSRKAEVVGCDFSREGLLSLQQRRDKGRALNLVECNLSNMPFAEEKFDAVVCVHTLSHLLREERAKAAAQMAAVLKRGGHLFAEGFGRKDLRFGDGEKVEEASFARGNGIMTHYFVEGEMQGLFPSLKLLSEVASTKRVSYGARAGKRERLRALFEKPL